MIDKKTGYKVGYYFIFGDCKIEGSYYPYYGVRGLALLFKTLQNHNWTYNDVISALILKIEDDGKLSKVSEPEKFEIWAYAKSAGIEEIKQKIDEPFTDDELNKERYIQDVLL